MQDHYAGCYASILYYLQKTVFRFNFDQYKCTFQSKGFVHTLIFLLYCLCVLVMTLNIAVDYTGSHAHRRLIGKVLYYYGRGARVNLAILI